jgi:Zn-dependent metalloprotease
VHINSGVPNHAFHLAATALGGNSWDQAGQVWYATLMDLALRAARQAATVDFKFFAELTLKDAAAQSDPRVLDEGQESLDDGRGVTGGCLKPGG